MMSLKLPDAVSRASRYAGFHLRSLQPRRLPGLVPTFQTSVARLRLQGVWSTSLDALQLPETDQMLATADRLCCQLPRGDVAFQGMAATASHSVGLASRQLMAHPAIFLWGLQHPWLNLAECYLRQPAAYLGCVLRREVPNQRQVGVRLWHQDGEDYKTIKVIVYLNDVADTGGPFEYIPRSLTPAYGQFRSVNNRIDNAAMAQVVGPERWRRCPGPRGTVIVAFFTMLQCRIAIATPSPLPTPPLPLNIGPGVCSGAPTKRPRCGQIFRPV